MKYEISCVIEAEDKDDARDIVKRAYIIEYGFQRWNIKEVTLGGDEIKKEAFAQGKKYGIKEQKERDIEISIARADLARKRNYGGKKYGIKEQKERDIEMCPLCTLQQERNYEGD